MNRRAKIVATIGPASEDEDCLRQLMHAGMDVARINFSHGTHGENGKMIGRIRRISQELDKAVTIMQDLRGPKLRTGRLEEGPVELTAGSRFRLSTEPCPPSESCIHISYPDLPKDLSPGDKVLLDDGAIELLVTEIGDTRVDTEVKNGGLLGSNKGVNLPGVDISTPSLTEKDRSDLAFGIEHGVDAVAMSFVRRPEDVVSLRDAIADCEPDRPSLPIIAKLERPEAVEKLKGILENCDGVMVARGDLGVEVSPERVPSLQKHIIHEANAELKLVITATQMLETMMENPRPTRAEASDVANAVFDGSDALMLSGETAIGAHPIAAVSTMSRIILDAEQHAPEWGYRPSEVAVGTEDDAVATTHAARSLAHDRDVAAIAVFTRSGRTARLMSKARPRMPIYAFTPEESTYRQLAMLWGVHPNLVPMADSVEEMIDRLRSACLAAGAVQIGEQVVLVASLPVGAMGPPNFTLLHKIE
jgi:pyruvate kinase